MAKPKTSSKLSGSIVSFIDHMLPLYVEERVDGVSCARSLRDGTLIRPVDEPIDEAEGRVEIWWQGDRTRATIAKGVFVTRLALSDYVAFHNRGKPERIAVRTQQLAEHFELKTGSSLGLESDDEMIEVVGLVGAALKELGKHGAIEALKKTIGL